MPDINVNINQNNNTNISSIFILTNQEIKNKVEDNTYLSDKDKTELIDLLKKIEDIKNSDESKTKKWNKVKTLLAFIADKGADIAIMFLPKIWEVLNK